MKLSSFSVERSPWPKTKSIVRVSCSLEYELNVFLPEVQYRNKHIQSSHLYIEHNQYFKGDNSFSSEWTAVYIEAFWAEAPTTQTKGLKKPL